MTPKKLKTFTDLDTDFRRQKYTDEKAYPTVEAAPNFRQSARWKCCWPKVDRSRHRRSGDPVLTIAPDLSRRSEAHCRPADLPTCVLDSTRSSDASITFNSKVGSSPPAFPPSHACPPRSQQLFECLLRCYRAALSSNSHPFPTLSSKKLK